jgi:hypothetical protein
MAVEVREDVGGGRSLDGEHGIPGHRLVDRAQKLVELDPSLDQP